MIHPDDPGEPGTGKPRISIAPEEGQLLSSLAAMKLVVEIGTGLGVSTRALAATAHKVITVDIDPWVKHVVVPELPDNVMAVDHREQARPYGPYDMAFIDGRHTEDETMRDIGFVHAVIERGVIVVHDANIEEVVSVLDDSWYIVHTTHGLAIRFVGYT